MARRGRGRIVVAVAVIATVAAACGGSSVGDGAAGSATPAVSPTPSASATPSGPPTLPSLVSVPVGGEPIGIAEGVGSLWVSSYLDSTVSRIDPATNAVTGTYQVSEQGGINANQLLASAEGDLWFPMFDSEEVLRVAVPPGPSVIRLTTWE